jgi:hypothetical protein
MRYAGVHICCTEIHQSLDNVIKTLFDYAEQEHEFLAVEQCLLSTSPGKTSMLTAVVLL